MWILEMLFRLSILSGSLEGHRKGVERARTSVACAAGTVAWEFWSLAAIDPRATHPTRAGLPPPLSCL